MAPRRADAGAEFGGTRENSVDIEIGGKASQAEGRYRKDLEL